MFNYVNKTVVLQHKLINFKSGLYVVSTPIGNMMDITLNAIEILKLSDLILCEDTRVSKKILEKHSIKNKAIFAYHKFNDKKSLTKIIKSIDNQKIVSKHSKVNVIKQYSKKTILPSQLEIKSHSDYLKKEIKKNYF